MIRASIVALSLLVPASAGAACQDDPAAAIATRLRADAVAGDSVVAAWSHADDQWSIYDWDGARLVQRPGTPFLEAGRLQVSAPNGKSVLLFVTDTNPLVYGAKAAVLTSAPTSEIAALQKLASLLGGSLAALVQQRAQTKDTRFRVACEADPKWDLALAALAAEASAVADLAADIGRRHSRAVSWIQVAETGTIPAGDIEAIVHEAAGRLIEVDRRFTGLEAARDEVARGMPCGEMAESASPLLDETDKLLGRRQTLFKAAAWLRQVEAEARRHGFDPCRLVNGVVAVANGRIDAAMGRRNSGGFQLSAAPPSNDFLLARPAPVERKVDVFSTTRWGIGAAVIYTPLEEKRWSAVPDPADPTRRVIGETARITRAGQIALLANVQRTRLGLQFGAATSSDKPGLFLGGSIDLGPWLRVGSGITWQRVRTLAEGQTELVTVVPNDAAIRYRDSFPVSWYAALTLSLDGIPLW